MATKVKLIAPAVDSTEVNYSFINTGLPANFTIDPAGLP